MQFSTLRNSFSISISFDADKAADVAAIAVGKAVRNATKYALDRAIADTRTLIKAERNAKDAICNVVSNTFQVAEAVIEATDARIDANIEAKVVAPALKAKVAIVKPISKAWNTSLDAITHYLEATPIKAAPVAESFPAIELPSLKQAIVEDWPSDIVEEALNPIAIQNEINAAMMEETPQVIDGALISSAGVTSIDNITEDKPKAIAATETVEEVQPKALIREEVAANN